MAFQKGHSCRRFSLQSRMEVLLIICHGLPFLNTPIICPSSCSLRAGQSPKSGSLSVRSKKKQSITGVLEHSHGIAVEKRVKGTSQGPPRLHHLLQQLSRSSARPKQAGGSGRQELNKSTNDPRVMYKHWSGFCVWCIFCIQLTTLHSLKE